jgi:LysR family glycine cleavage system transcriptional activator
MSDWLPSLYSLRAYEAVARHLSYKAAAEELNVTPAAVKQLVVKLEAALGAKLVERVGHRLQLTQNGMAGRKDMELAMLHMSESVKRMRHRRHDTRLIVTVEASIATTWLVPRLEKFRTANPGIDVLVDSSQRVLDLKREDVDIAIRYGVPPEEGVVTKRLFEDLVLPACSPSMPDIPQNLGDLAKSPLIHWDLSQMPWARNTRQWFDWGSWFEHQGIHNVDTSKGLRFSDYGLAVQAAISGQGVLLAGWPALHDAMEAALLVCPLPEHIHTTDIGFDVATTEGASQKPSVIAFVGWLVHIAEESSSRVLS